MAFINDYLTKEETLALEAMRHYEFRWCENYKTGRACTVDRERKIWLIKVPIGYNCDWEFGVDKFLLFFDEIVEKKQCVIYMKKYYNEKNVELLEKYNIDYIINWSIEKIDVSKMIDMTENEIINSLQEALQVYGVNGTEKYNSIELQKEFKAIIIK